LTHRVVFTPEARDQLDALHAYIASVADADTATRFVGGIIDHAETLRDFPARGTPRDDLRAGLRTISWRRRVTLAFMVEKHDVVVIGAFYGGRDVESLLKET
jgi:toxin ParE1/3/4